jgi:hypothetical protein
VCLRLAGSLSQLSNQLLVKCDVVDDGGACAAFTDGAVYEEPLAMRFEKDGNNGVVLLEVKSQPLLGCLIGILALGNTCDLKYSSRKTCGRFTLTTRFRLEARESFIGKSCSTSWLESSLVVTDKLMCVSLACPSRI